MLVQDGIGERLRKFAVGDIEVVHTRIALKDSAAESGLVACQGECLASQPTITLLEKGLIFQLRMSAS